MMVDLCRTLATLLPLPLAPRPESAAPDLSPAPRSPLHSRRRRRSGRLGILSQLLAQFSVVPVLLVADFPERRCLAHLDTFVSLSVLRLEEEEVKKKRKT